MNFFIKQNSSLPVLIYPLTESVMDKYGISEEMLEDVAVTFSMVLKDEGIYKIANTTGDLYINEDPYSTEFITKYNLIFRFKTLNTNKVGIYDGEFKIDFLNGCCGKMTIPEIPIQIVINPSITKTNVISETLITPAPVSPIPIITGTDRVAIGETITLSALPNGMASYSWTGPNGFTGNTQTINITNTNTNNTGQYILTVVNSQGLSGSAGFNVVVYNTWKFTIKTDAFGTTNINEFTLPTVNGYEYNANINWGDGNTTQLTRHTDIRKKHTYSLPGTYQITIDGLFEAFSFGLNNSNDANKLISLDTPISSEMGLYFINNGFYNCDNLVSICNELFKYTPLITDFNVLFGNCKKLTTIPSDLFSYSLNATNFGASFYGCDLLSAIPSGLFNNNIDAVSFSATFYNCIGLTSIPDNLFNDNVNVVDFGDCFNGCIGLVTIPENIFIYNINVVNYSATFANCKNLILPSVVFNLGVIGIVESFSQFMYIDNVLDSYTGTIQDIWLNNTITTHDNAFTNQVNISNYSSIPIDWI